MQSKYPNTPISIVDNILDWRYIDTLIPRLADRGGIHEVFVETKSTLTKTQLRMMRMAGIKRIQPGIESLSTSVLKLMKKGVSAAQNIAFLRRCLEVGIKPEWNLLWGFPNEDLSEYAKMPELISHIIHLPPPIAASTLRIDRYSPLFEKASHETIARIRPHSAYESIFDSSDVNIERLAYYFEIDYQDGRQPHCYTEELVRGCRKWQESWHEAFLFYLIVDTNVIVADGRNPEQVRMMRFPGRVIHLLEHCECPHRREDVISWFNGMMGADSQLCLEELINRHLLLEVDDSIVTVVSNLFDFPHNSEKIVSFVQSMNRQADRYDDTMLTVKVPEVTC
jgi:ribosomal peptide maturation radical SAM protein 1